MAPPRVTDPGAVRRAIEECDQLGRDEFARRYGFARSTRYALVVDGQHYDPAPIVAVAHGSQHGAPLQSSEVRGATTTLRGLGFEIIDFTPEWDVQEMLLALCTYLCRPRPITRPLRSEPDVRLLSETLRRLAGWRGRPLASVTRNPPGIEQQVGKFLNLDPRTALSGRGEPSALHREVWADYAHDVEKLCRAVGPLLNDLEASGWTSEFPLPKEGIPTRQSTHERPKVSRKELLAPFSRQSPRAPVTPAAPVQVDSTKHDRALAQHEDTRLLLARFLARHGLELAQGRSEERQLLLDLAVDASVTWIVEVKSLPDEGDDHRTLRQGLGQLLWYRSRWRHRTDDPCIAVLCVERCPADANAWLHACADVSVILTWPARFGSLLGQCAELSKEGRLTVELEPEPGEPTPAPPPPPAPAAGTA
ncbi:MAG: hypothetical protein KDK70_10080 [Myxococcales bacterium]|nr:hypothetical protein [Myxococcales bacterium]